MFYWDLKAIWVQWTHWRLQETKLRRSCSGHKGDGHDQQKYSGRVKWCSVGTKGPKVYQENRIYFSICEIIRFLCVFFSFFNNCLVSLTKKKKKNRRRFRLQEMFLFHSGNEHKVTVLSTMKLSHFIAFVDDGGWEVQELYGATQWPWTQTVTSLFVISSFWKTLCCADVCDSHVTDWINGNYSRLFQLMLITS